MSCPVGIMDDVVANCMIPVTRPKAPMQKMYFGRLGFNRDGVDFFREFQVKIIKTRAGHEHDAPEVPILVVDAVDTGLHISVAE